MKESIFPDVYDKAFGNNDSCLENEGIEFMKKEHALMNVVVLDSIGRHLKYEDIQKFRLVCQRWNEVFETVTWKLSRIKIKHKPDSRYLTKEAFEEETKKLIQDYNSIFPFPELYSNAVVFEGVIDYSLLDYFWKERGSTKLTNVYFRDVFDQSSNFIDLSPFLTQNLSTLHIKHAPALFHIIISLEMLPNVQNLYLEYCQIVLNGKIAPKELTILERNNVIYKGVLFEFINGNYNSGQKILLNDFVDFSKIKKLCLRGKIWRLDVGRDSQHLEYLDISEVDLVGLTNSQWTTDRLDLVNVKDNIYIGDRMELKSLISEVDIKFVDLRPMSTRVEKMSISYCIQPIVPNFFMYQKLKYLSLEIFNHIEFPILNFTNCSSLVDFRLKHLYEHRDMDLKRIIFPKCIKRVKLCNIEVVPVADGSNWKLDTLILSKCSLSFAETLLKHVSFVKLVLELSNMTHQDEISILNLWKNSNVQIIAFGSNKSNISGNSEELLKYVDKAGSHFAFNKENNGNGKSIHTSHFKSLCTLSPHEKDLKAKFHFRQ